MNDNSVREIVGKFMSDTFLFDFDTKITPHSDLFEAGFIDSFGFVQLIGFIEEFFQIEISEDELASDEIRSLNGIIAIVSRAQAQALLDSSGEAKQAIK